MVGETIQRVLNAVRVSERAHLPMFELREKWSACDWPISPPSEVAAALFDMFCGLNGRTLKPRRVNARHSPAQIIDLPTFDAVPWLMMAGHRGIVPS